MRRRIPITLGFLLATLVLGRSAFAADTKALDELKAVFDTAPAAGFVKAEEMFREAKATGDLEGMANIIQVVGSYTLYCNC